MEDRIDRLEERIQRHEERMTRLEISQAELASDLRGINGKLDRILAQIEHILENFVSTPSCAARVDHIKQDINGLGAKLRNTVEQYETHIRYHWSRADKMATWMTTTIIGVFVIGKMAKVW